ncbi:CDP-diacylglycerol--glycerol-3-phosphate 3-phosphatidyltransferase [Hydrogenispora ethanolica]|uniref:CDP-diacylglycerol--glycerol-3-phosphate 3-phosphatidyltransferase n=1 Tax=Hydrogenispora ethanolica TaxID=1082276 RepID=A0A4R1RXB1_HYDET|nr:CDP-diacylglycerol--glycerol-3-phosphate 3-phosphatidyltransferase [Hydrogenispora ethanolica]TCL70820.1 CDP-diacylglycerol--glycerol-3-phosphate 3-phosphatidyltransferase [Hydrogenispora ethanolica]
MSLANWITALRIILALVCVGILFWNIPGRDLLAAIIFIIAGLTDGLDGYAARIRKEITSFGKSFDPFADKVLIILTLVVLANLKRVPWPAVWIIILREVMITILRHFAGKKGLAIAASPWGKLKTFVQIVAIALIMLKIPYSLYFLWLAVLLTICSGLDYLWRWRGAFGMVDKNR